MHQDLSKFVSPQIILEASIDAPLGEGARGREGAREAGEAVGEQGRERERWERVGGEVEGGGGSASRRGRGVHEGEGEGEGAGRWGECKVEGGREWRG
jgi:hypothetical protein